MLISRMSKSNMPHTRVFTYISTYATTQSKRSHRMQVTFVHMYTHLWMACLSVNNGASFAVLLNYWRIHFPAKHPLHRSQVHYFRKKRGAKSDIKSWWWL